MKTFTVLEIRLEEKLKLGDFFSEGSRIMHSTFPLFTLRLFSQLSKIGKTDMGLATFPTLPLEKSVNHTSC